MFEVGKLLTTSSGNKTVEILYVTDDNILVKYRENPDYLFVGKEFCWSKKDILNSAFGWKEYKEPVIEKYIRGVYPSAVDSGPVALTSGRADDHIGEIEFTLRDGKLTDVRIVV